MNAVSKPNPGREFGHQLIEMKGQLAQALPAGIAPDRFIRITLTAIQLTPELLECERKLAPQLADTLRNAALPDPASYESTQFHMVADARLAISEAEDAETVHRVFSACCAALVDFEAEIPDELKRARDERLERLAG